MKKIFLTSACTVLTCFSLMAQSLTEEEGSDIQTVGNEIQIDSTIAGRSVFQILPDGVSVYQSALIGDALKRQIAENELKQYQGFRIRIFFDSAQSARAKSSAVLEKFRQSHPDMVGYRSYDSPNFKVTVGNFRNRTEAEAALEILKKEFPSAFVVREKFKYPAIGRYASTVDSLKTAF